MTTLGDIVFHVGLHKTGTTWLQTVLFSAHPQLALLCDAIEPWSDPLLRFLIAASECEFSPTEARRLLKERASHAFHTERPRALVVSAERLSGHPASGGFDRALIAKRIWETFPQAKIVCVVREQNAMIDSVYRQLVTEGHTSSLQDLLNEDGWKRPGFRLGYFEYDHLLSAYKSLFGEQNVRFLAYEELRNDPLTFVTKLCQFVGVDVWMPSTIREANVSIPASSIWLLRRLNHFRRTSLNPSPLVALPEVVWRGARKFARAVDGTFSRRSQAINVELALLLCKHFEMSNKRLAEMTGGEIDYRPKVEGWREDSGGRTPRESATSRTSTP